MSLPPLRRDQSIAVLKPNPMWILSSKDREALYNLVMLRSAEDPALNLPLIAHDDCADIAEKTLKGLIKYWQYSNKGKVLFYVHIESTVNRSLFIHSDGAMDSRLSEDQKHVRHYFDGSYVEKGNMGHAAAAVVDFREKKIITQDSQGIPIKPLVAELLQKYFPDFEFNDLQLKQQWDAHSCSILTVHNLERFCCRQEPETIVDTQELRARYAGLLSNPERRLSQHDRASRYYEAPIRALPYYPV